MAKHYSKRTKWKMKIIIKEIKELIFAEYNPRKLTNKEHSDLKQSLKKFGMVEPIVINKNKDRKNVIIGGHQRCRIWQEFGHRKIPCHELDLNIEQEKELNIRLNKNVGSWDHDLLANVFNVDDLFDYGFEEKDLIGFFSPDDDEKENEKKSNVCEMENCPKLKI